MSNNSYISSTGILLTCVNKWLTFLKRTSGTTSLIEERGVIICVLKFYLTCVENFPFPSVYSMFTMCTCLYVYACMYVCLCLYNQPSESLPHIFLWITRHSNCPQKIHIQNSHYLPQSSFSSVPYLIEWVRSTLPYHSPKMDS